MSEKYSEQDVPIRAYLSYYIDGAITSIWQNFPTTRDELEANLSGNGVPPDKIADIQDAIYETAIDDLDRRLPRNPDLDELNYLAVRIEAMSEIDRVTFSAVMQAMLHCESMTEIINAVDNLDRFDLYPGDFSDHEFGGIMVEMHSNEHTEVIERLRTSDDPQEKSFAAYAERLESSLDLVKYGHLAREADNGVLTESGYLLLPDEPLPERYTGPQDIPRDQLVAARADAPKEKPSLLAALKAAKTASRAAEASRPDTPEKQIPSGPEL